MLHKRAFALLFALVFVSLANANLLLTSRLEEKEQIAGWGINSYADAYKANERALVMLSGKGSDCLGLYVFDAQGNCVAKNDVTSPLVCDDLAVEWVPPESVRYSVEVRNAGSDVNPYSLAIR